MNKSFYIFATLFFALVAGSGVFTSVLHYFLGQDIFQLGSFQNWYLTGVVLQLASILFLLVYLYHKKYQLAFYTGILALVACLCMVFVIFKMMSLEKQFVVYHRPALYFTLSASLLFALTLLFSNTKNSRLLRITGLLSTILGVILLATLIGFFNTVDPGLKASLEKIHNWTSWIASLIPVIYVIHFRREGSGIPNDMRDQDRDNFKETGLGLVLMVSAVLTLYLGFMLGVEGYRSGRPTAKDKLLAQQFQARFFVGSKNDTLYYRLLKPLHYDSKKKYPVVVCLHGGAGWGTDNIKQVGGSLPAQMLSEPANREKYPAFLFVPQCARGSSWGGLPNHRTIDTLAFEAIASLEKEFSIDGKRRYVSGNSLGGYGTWHFISTRPDMFAAAIPISGEGDPRFGVKIAQVPVWAFHGDVDMNVPVSGSRNIVKAMQFAGGHPKYTEYPGAGHDIWKSVTGTPGLLDWLFAQKKE